MEIKRASNWFYLIPGITEELQSPTQETVGREPETIGREPETTGMEPETAGSEPNNNELTIKRGKKRLEIRPVTMEVIVLHLGLARLV